MRGLLTLTLVRVKLVKNITFECSANKFGGLKKHSWILLLSVRQTNLVDWKNHFCIINFMFRNSWPFIVGVATNFVLYRKWISTFRTLGELYFVSAYAWHYGEVTIACKNTPLTTWAQESQCLKASRRYYPPLWFVRPTFLLTIRGIILCIKQNIRSKSNIWWLRNLEQIGIKKTWDYRLGDWFGNSTNLYFLQFT